MVTGPVGGSLHDWLITILSALLLGLLPTTAAAQGLGTITGTVVDAEGDTPLIGAEVALRAIDDPTVLQATQTASDGTFRLTEIPPGRYVVEVSALGYQERQLPLTVEMGESPDLEIELRLDPFSLQTSVVSPSRRRQRLLDAPAAVSVLEPERIRREATTSSVEALRAVEGVDVAQTGFDRREVAFRGFNSDFSTAPHVLTDHREAVAPSLGLNLYSVMPNTTLDLKRIEAVRGPVAALYGTGVDSGVLHFFTKGPFQDPGTSIAVSGGSREYVNVQFRQAGVLGDKVGYKFTGQWGRADEWDLDPDNPKDAAELSRYRVYDDPNANALVGRTFVTRDVDGDGDPDAQLRRENLYRRYNVNGLLKYRINDETSLALRGGFASLKSPLQSPIGTLQASSLASSYGQLRFETSSFSTQLTLNRDLPESEVYLLRTGNRITEDGTQFDGRLQYAFGLDALDTEVLVGGEADATFLQQAAQSPISVDEEFGTVGTYLQTTTSLAPSFSLSLAGRADYPSVYDEVKFSPRAALVFTPTSNHALRASYNRAVSLPSTSPLLPRPRTNGAGLPEETITHTLEVGYKGQFARRLRLNVDGYYETRENVIVPVGTPVQYRQLTDAIEYWGLDAALEARPTEAFTIFANTSVVSDDFFALDGPDRPGPPRRTGVALNAPSFKVKGGVDYGLPQGLSVGATVHHVDDFPVQSGPYTGTVDAYTLLDLRVGASIPAVPGLSVNVTAKNVLDTDHREFVGAPALGRTIIGRLTYELL